MSILKVALSVLWAFRSGYQNQYLLLLLEDLKFDLLDHWNQKKKSEVKYPLAFCCLFQDDQVVQVKLFSNPYRPFVQGDADHAVCSTQTVQS